MVSGYPDPVGVLCNSCECVWNINDHGVVHLPKFDLEH